MAGAAAVVGAATRFQSLTSCSAASLIGSSGALRSLLTVLPTPDFWSASMDMGMRASKLSSCSVRVSYESAALRASHSSTRASDSECEKRSRSGLGGVASSTSMIRSSAVEPRDPPSSLIILMSESICTSPPTELSSLMSSAMRSMACATASAE